MCGIVGVMSAAPIEPHVIVAMRDTLAHRGPDHAGLWSSPDGRVSLAHRRLSIVDLTPEANQPYVAADEQLVLTFGGEIYNFRRLREELIALGARFRTRSDTEVLLEAYRHWGDRCVERFSGMFAFAIWDAAARRLYCARDRAGEKPFYYGIAGGCFMFASEAKALLRWPGVHRRISYPALVDYLTLGYVPDPKCIWDGLQKLPPGCAMSVAVGADGTPEIVGPYPYWDMVFDPDETVADWRPRIRETLQAAAREMIHADVPVGAFLSGGVDSSSVTAALSLSGHTVRTFTIGFPESDFDERTWARRIARRYETVHTERTVTPEDIDPVFDRLLWHYDEPFNDYSYLPTYYVCREARRVITVALTGDGGDELFAGYSKYRRLALRQAVAKFAPAPVTALIASAAGGLGPIAGPVSRALLPYAADPATMLCGMLNTGLPLPLLRAASRGELAGALKHYDPMETVLAHLKNAPPREVGFVNSMRYLDLKLTLAGDILVKVDRASMAVSLEARPVYLHRDMLSLAASVPPRLLATRRHAKKLLKSALTVWLPRDVLHRRKMGFAMPLGPWLTTGRPRPFREAPTHSPLSEWLDETQIVGTAESMTAGATGTASVVHSLAFLKHWMTRWLDRPPALAPEQSTAGVS